MLHRVVCLVLCNNCLALYDVPGSDLHESDSDLSWSVLQLSRIGVHRQASIHEHTGKAVESSVQHADLKGAKTHMFQRPGYGGPSDTVKFGLFCKSLVSMDMKTSTFVADLVLTSIWSDNPAASVVPHNHSHITLPTAEAQQRMWLPDVVITNQGIYGSNLISSAISISIIGEVQQTDRLLATVIHKLDVIQFPYDIQNLSVWAASSFVMTDELKLIPSEDLQLRGSSPGAFQLSGFSLTSQDTKVIETIDGALRKSRGIQVWNVVRKTEGYTNMVLIPEVFMLTLSISALLFQLEPRYTMPRMSVSLLALVAFMTIAIRSSSCLPTRESTAWIDIFDQTCIALLLLVLLCHVLQEIMSHIDSCKGVAKALNSQAPIFCTLLTLTMVSGLVFFGGKVPVPVTAAATRCVLVSAVLIYSCSLALTSNCGKP